MLILLAGAAPWELNPMPWISQANAVSAVIPFWLVFSFFVCFYEIRVSSWSSGWPQNGNPSTLAVWVAGICHQVSPCHLLLINFNLFFSLSLKKITRVCLCVWYGGGHRVLYPLSHPSSIHVWIKNRSTCYFLWDLVSYSSLFSYIQFTSVLSKYLIFFKFFPRQDAM